MILVERQLYRGPRPLSYEELQYRDIKQVIDLESGVYDDLHKDPYDTQNPADFGIKKINIPCSDIFAPYHYDVMRAVAFMSQDIPTYIHCLHGNDRTGYVCAAYRMIVDKWTFKDATKEMYDLGFHRVPYQYWVLFLKKYEANIKYK